MDFRAKNISFVGFDELHEDDRDKIKQIIADKYPFIEREIKKINGIKVHVKAYQEGGRKKYSIHLAVDSPGGYITAEDVYSSAQWDPVASVYILVDKVREQIRHRFHD